MCLTRFNGFWEIEDHFWAKHPNVYHSFYEFPAEQDPGAEFVSVYLRYVLISGIGPKFENQRKTHEIIYILF